MHRSFFATKDTFINSGSNLLDGTTFQDKNTGKDEVLELKKVFFDRTFHAPTRVLIQFNTNEVENYISSSILPSDYKINLRMYETEGVSGLSEEYKIAAYPLSQEWDEGVGKEADDPKTTDGCSWLYRKNRDGATEISWTDNGGTYIAGDEVTQSFSSESPDINMDITTMAKKWFGGVNENYGLLLRLSGSRESSTGSFEDLKFFSRQTNTIYSPKLEVQWDDSTHSFGSLTPLDVSGNSENYLYRLHAREAYKENETVKFRFGARKRYIDKSFSTSVQTVSGSYLGEGSCFIFYNRYVNQ